MGFEPELLDFIENVMHAHQYTSKAIVTMHLRFSDTRKHMIISLHNYEFRLKMIA